MAGKRNQNQNKNKEENRLYFCSLCPFVASSYEELDLHYSLAHDELDDVSYELELAWEEIKQKKKPRTLKEKALEELKLLIEGKDYHNEYVGWCTVYYEIYSKQLPDRYVIKIRPTAEVC